MSKDVEDIEGIDEAQVLKDMVHSQRQELNKKNDEIISLEENISKLTSELKFYKKLEEEFKDTSLLENAHDLIDNLMNEKADLDNQISSLNNKIINLERQNEILLANLEKAKSSHEVKNELESKNYQLHKRITELEQENMILRESNEQIRPKLEQITDLTKKIEKYEERIESLENVNELHRNTIDDLRAELASDEPNFNKEIEDLNDMIEELEKENAELREKLQDSEVVQSHSSVEDNITRLQKKVAALENENKELSEKNQLLKAALLLHVDTETADINNLPREAPSIPISEKKEEKIENILSKTHEVIEDSKTEAIESSKDEIKVPKGKVQDLVKQRHEALEEQEKLINEKPEVPIDIPQGLVKGLVEKRHSAIESDDTIREIPRPKPKTEKVQKIQEKSDIKTTPPEETKKTPVSDSDVPDLEEIGVIETGEGKRVCPICGNRNFRLIRELEDKTKIISAYPRMYGKKFKCGQCGAEWR